MAIQAGTKLGRYEIRSLLGAGGMGEVYAADDPTLHRPVAIKVLHADVMSDKDRRRRFELEAFAASSLNHPNILTIHEIGHESGYHYMVTEFIEGESLGELMKRETLSVSEVLDVGIQIAAALTAAHAAGIVHRDIKPDNIMLRLDHLVKVLDFGLAKLSEPEQTSVDRDGLTKAMPLTTPGLVMGTARYMSPEQARGLPVDARTDVWSLGVVLYEMMGGHPPFIGKTMSDVIAAVLTKEPPALTTYAPSAPPELERIVTKALHKEEADRYQSVKEFGQDLKNLKQRLEFEAELERSGGANKPSAASSRGEMTTIVHPARQTDDTRATQDHLVHTTSSAEYVVGKIKRHKLGVVVAAVIVIIASVAGLLYWRLHKSVLLTDKDTIVIADFVNTTGDAVFDGTLRQGLAAQLEQSPLLSLVSDDRIAETLKLLAKPDDSRLTHQLAHDVCRRAGGKATVEGAISGIGGPYELSLEAVDCASGDVLAEMRKKALSKEQVVPALGEMAATMRKKLGESLASVQKYNVPAENVTTGSLEALQAYSQAYRAQNVRADPKGAIALFEQATNLDPNFAMAYGRLAANYRNTGEYAKAEESARKAYDLRQRVSERERFYIESAYQESVTDNAEATLKIFEAWAQAYPRDDIPPNNLGNVYTRLGDYEKALSAYQRSLSLDPESAITYSNVTGTYVRLERLDEAKATIQEAKARGFDSPNLHYFFYYFAFLEQDADGMEREAAYLMGNPGTAPGMLYVESETAAYRGQISRARELAMRVVDPMRADRKLLAGSFEVEAALREALVGNLAVAKRQAEDALTLTDNQYVQAVSAAVLGLTGDSVRATKMADDLASRYSENTSMQIHYLPMIRCAVALQEGNAAKALEGAAASTPYDLGSPRWLGYVRLYPVYLRGQAYLAAHQAAPATATFQKILDHPGVVLDEPIGALAHLGLGRAYAMAGDSSKAKSAYQDFFALWKDADPDLPILKAAQAEYGKLK